MVNIFQLLAGLLFRILSNVYNIDGTKTSIFLCKTRMSILLAAVLISLTCMCFAAADQYASITARWKHLSQKHLAYWFMWNFEHNLYCVLYSSCCSNSIRFFYQCWFGTFLVYWLLLMYEVYQDEKFPLFVRIVIDNWQQWFENLIIHFNFFSFYSRF